MTIAPSESSFRPGTKFFAPQVRLVTPEGRPVLIEDRPVDPDVISVSVTQPCSGVGQVEIVLNNQRHDSENRPVWPSWRYNRLDTIRFGTRLRVDMRYGGDGWTPMLLARITDINFQFPPTAGAQVTLKGEDLLSLLKAKPPGATFHFTPQEVDMVEHEVRSSESRLTVVAPEPRNLFSARMADVTHEPAKTYLQFIDSLAERMDYEVYVGFDDPGAPVAGEAAFAREAKLHFAPSRSATLGDPVPLAWGKDIVEFKPAFKVWELLTSAKAVGNVPGRRGAIDVEVQMADAINDLHAAPGGAAPVSAIRARSGAFADENSPETNTETLTAANLDEERSRMQATAALRRSARNFLTAELTTLGYTRLVPGIHVDLSGFYAPFDGIYYVTQAVHTLSAAGYATKLSLRRPGMLDPAAYPGA